MTIQKRKVVFPILAVFFVVTLLFVTIPYDAYAETKEERVESIGQQAFS